MAAIRLRRRDLIAAALVIGAAPLLAGVARRSRLAWREAPQRFPHGVASGDPKEDGVILWTRRDPIAGETRARLRVEIAEDVGFARVVGVREVVLDARADWTCRVLIAGLRPDRLYWYRFIDEAGNGSRVGRTRTAPHIDASRAVNFAFVSCQNANIGHLAAWRRMVHDDEGRSEGDRIEFVLHLGDFVYDTLWYPADRPQGYFDRKVRGIATYPDGERHDDYHVPTTVGDYRILYRAYLEDRDLQTARANWPFVCIWDNGEFSNEGWQGLQRFGSITRPAQSRKVAANQAWFEYIPSRARTTGASPTDFAAPAVVDEPVERFDSSGLGQETNNLAAIRSLVGYRTHRWGAQVELVLTDQRGFRSEDYTAAPDAKAITSVHFPQMVPIETLESIDAGATAAGGNPPPVLQFADRSAPNFRRAKRPRTLLGDAQKAWLLESLRTSTATWKIWGDTVATFDMRADPQNLPEGIGAAWPGQGYAGFPRTDHSTTYAERAEILDFVEEKRIAGFAILSGDRHSFWAGYAAKALPPAEFRPVGVNFVVGSISSPGMVEALEHSFPKEHALRPLYLIDRRPGAPPEPAVNLLLRHGVRSCLEYAASGDLTRARKAANPANAPHVAFVDMGGHGYGMVRASASKLSVGFVCVPRPVEDKGEADGGPVRYRVTHEVELWEPGARPILTRSELVGDAGLSA